MFRKFIARLLVAGLVIGTASFARAADNVKFGSIRVPVQVFVGIKKGFFSRQDVEVEPVFFKSGAEIAPALATGQIDAAFTTSGAALFNGFARGAKMVIVAEALALEPGAPGGDPTAIVIRADLARGGAVSAQDLKGHTLAVTAPGQILDIVVQTYLKKNGLTASDVKIVGMPMPDMVPALSNGALDAAIVIDPFLTALVDSGKAKVLARSAEVLPDASQSFLALSNDLAQKRDVAVRFVRGYVDANTWMRYALKTSEGREEIAAIFQEFVPAKSADVYVKIALGTASAGAEVNVDGEYGLRWQLKVLTDAGLIKGDPKLDEHLDTTILKDAKSR